MFKPGAILPLAAILLGTVALATVPANAQQNMQIQPSFDIWAAQIGQPVSIIPEMDVSILACGTNGGPASILLGTFEDFMNCPPEPSGLREVTFTYDDEQDYIARALNVEFQVVQGGTSVFAHPVVVAVLVDEAGAIMGQRIVTDDRVSTQVRRTAVTLARNFKARFNQWNLQCEDIPPQPGENPVGRQFIHEVCLGENAEGTQAVRIESSYLRKPGQQGLNPETQQVNTDYFESQTRIDIVDIAYADFLSAD